MSDLSRLNPTPHAIAVYASQPLSPVATQHSLPSGRHSLLGPDFHRLDRTSLRLAHLLDHLVGASEEGGWDRQTDFLSSLQIDDQFEPSRLLDGQLGRFASFEDFRDIVGRHQHHLRKVGTVGDETARVDPFAERMHDWETLSGL